MRTMLTLALTVACFFGQQTRTSAAWAWVIDGLPASISAAFEAEAFSVTGADAEGGSETMSLFTSIPTLGAGVSMDMPAGYVAVKAGFGPMLNTRLRAVMVYLDAEALFEVQRSVMIGPHAGLTRFSAPEWWGAADIDISDTTGYWVGLRLAMGDKISYVLSVDYFSLAFDVAPIAGWEPSDDEINMSGVGLQFGVRAQF